VQIQFFSNIIFVWSEVWLQMWPQEYPTCIFIESLSGQIIHNFIFILDSKTQGCVSEYLPLNLIPKHLISNTKAYFFSALKVVFIIFFFVSQIFCLFSLLSVHINSLVLALTTLNKTLDCLLHLENRDSHALKSLLGWSLTTRRYNIYFLFYFLLLLILYLFATW
jgi:hypothetical protein